MPPAPVLFPLAGRRVFVAGHRGLAGSAIARRLAREGCEILAIGREAVDLRRQRETEQWMAAARPEAVFVAAATVGGIQANASRPAEFLYDNIAIAANVIEAAHRVGVRKLVFLGSTCIYPRLAPQPMAEDSLLTGPLEPTNEWYAIAKIAGVKLCDAYRRQYGADFISIQPTSLYGPHDNFDLASAHVLPSLIRRFHVAKRAGAGAVELWGTGRPLREFMHADDLADAAAFLAERYSREGPINVGTGEEIAVADLAHLVAGIVGYRGDICFDAAKPDGMPRKLGDVRRLSALGWRPTVALADGIAATYRWFVENEAAIERGRVRPEAAGEAPTAPVASSAPLR